MALDKDRLGAALWNTVKATAGPFTPAIAPAQDSQGLALWTAVAQEIINEFKSFGDIDLATADVKTLPGTFNVTVAALNTPTPVLGLGENQAVTLTGKIK